MPSTIWRSVSSFCTGFPLRSAFVDAESDQSTFTCREPRPGGYVNASAASVK